MALKMARELKLKASVLRFLEAESKRFEIILDGGDLVAIE